MAGNQNSGRRTTEEELALQKQKLKEQALEEIARTKVFNHLKMMKSEDRQGVKEIALPIYLKSRPEKVDVTTDGQPIYGGKSK